MHVYRQPCVNAFYASFSHPLQINSEIMRFSHGMHAACTTLATNLKASQLESADALAKSRRQLMKEEEDAKLRAQSLTESLARSQSKLAEAESKLIELAQKNQELADEVCLHFHSHYAMHICIVMSNDFFGKSRRMCLIYL
ncbi:unnamed protein product [Dibothriocephalus latus]|uniref:Uncharacterized protein n=1 Tax=Dibothriocephalus latus TaxID=60516 RepID=A0A3P7NMZ9_DIBLA|nr:unnamed protein product [Dibothriocephalus latus]